MSDAQEAAAVLAAINAQFSSVRAYLVGDAAVPTLTTDYILVSVERRYTDARRVGGSESKRGGRVSTTYVSKIATNVYELRARTAVALEGKILPLPGGDFGPFVFETAEPASPDDGWVSGYDMWTY